jgi:hypothetical protein
MPTDEERLEKKADELFFHQSEVDRLLGEIFEEDEQYGAEICELLREELYR